MIRVLIVDDEPLARERIRTLLAEDPEIVVADEFADGEAAVRGILRERPDLLFLDVQMPGLDGFEVLDAVRDVWLPAVVFVTAHDRHALRAFDVHALDYLLKPFESDRFRRALARVKPLVRGAAAAGDGGRLRALLDGLRTERPHLKRLVVNDGGRIVFLRIDEIDWIEAAGNYVRLHVGPETHLFRETMRSLESRLDPDGFLRVHRSTIVNVDRIRELRPWFQGSFLVVLTSGAEIPSSRSCASVLRARFGASS